MVEIVFESHGRQKAIDAIKGFAAGRLSGDHKVYVREVVSAEPNGSIKCTLYTMISKSGVGLDFDAEWDGSEMFCVSYVIGGNK